MTERERQGISKNEYSIIHTWIRRKYGRACKCESESCNGSSTNYSWALIKGKKYEKNIDNYIQLCQSCHIKYDWSEAGRGYMRNRKIPMETRIRISNTLKGRKANFSEADILRRSESMKGEKNFFFGKSISGENHPFFGRTHSTSSRKLISESRRLVSDELVSEIRYLYWLGCKQSVIADEYKMSRPRICKIVHNKILSL